MVPIEVALSAAIGAQIRITTAAPAPLTYEGTLFTADPITNLIVINTGSSTASAGNYQIIPISRLQSFNIISLPQSNGESTFATAAPPIAPLPLPSFRQREEAAIRRLKEQELKRGKGVTPEAQEIFNALTRTMPGRWEGQDMIISESVVISKPYRIEDCRALNESVSGSAVHRVRKVLEMEKKKIELRRSSLHLRDTPAKPVSSSANVNGQRKGG
ncbi:hypothetical protein UCRPC4_g00827 [Phaeomoniella chlamydospora]|uniref:AD domain-containing protein n=1 Tax=Phaeomoniella chlamydospora TaxID=158046 RepID=A0A0G2EZ43_PHACM|nr:hypothetical protein UCRPC4_g00827 [Phaeomoniella chlamydospora]